MQGVALHFRYMGANEWWRLVVAFVVLPLLGGVATALWNSIARRSARESSSPSDFKNGFLIGILERVFFVGLVGFGITGAGVAMIGWISAKMAAGWNPYRESDDPDAAAGNDQSFERVKNERMTGLVAGLISMLFALLGGLILGARINV